MQIFDFITQDEINDLPDDDTAAFLQFTKIASARLKQNTQNLNDDDEAGWRQLNDARHGFMNVITAAARRYGIEPFASMDVPRVGNFGGDDHRQFTYDLDHYMTQLLLNDGLGVKRDSVALSESAKDRIRTHVHHLREQLSKEGMPDEKRKDLLSKLEAFEEALNKRRLSLLALTRITIEILAAPGALSGSYDIATKLLSNVMQTVAQEKAQEDDRPAARIVSPIAILPSRPSEKARNGLFKDLDSDDIPF